MRRTRSNSVADIAKRSLRSTHNEEFCEIPTVFRVRSPRAAPDSNFPEKSPTRRSLRLQSGEENELKDGIKYRKRRFQTSPDDNKVITNGSRRTKSDLKEEYEAKPLKVLRSEDADATNSLPIENGMHRRTRQKHETSEINGTNHSTPMKKEDKSPTTPNSYSCSKSSASELSLRNFQHDEYANFSPRRTRNSPRCLRSSLSDHSSNCITPTESSTDFLSNHNCNNKMKQKASRVNKDKDMKETKDCECHSNLNKTFPIAKDETCQHCGKLQSYSPRKNGIITNGSMNKSTFEISPRSLRSSANAVTASSVSSIKCAGSPMAAEEASEKENSKSFENNSISSHLRGNRRKVENDVQNITDDNILDASKNSDESTSDKEDPESSVQDSVQISSSPADKTTEAENKTTSPNTEIADKTTNIPELILPNHITETETAEDKVITDTQSDHGIRDLKRSGSPSVFDEIACSDFDFISDNESDYSSYNRKKRKMNLRSSGVRCDPNFYTLSLDLMIKRPHRRSNLLSDWAETGVKSEKDNKQDEDQQEKEEPEQPSQETETTVNSPETSNQTENKSSTENETHVDRSNIQSLFTIKQDSQLDYLKISAVRENNRSRSSSPSCSSSTPRRGPTATVLHKLSRGGRRGPRGLSNTKLDRSPCVKIVAKDPSEPPPLFTEEPPSGPDVYFFESDHVALKHNRDYHNLLRTVSILESQRHQCLADIKTLENRKTDALDEPIEFVEKLQKKAELDLPRQQNVIDLPDIDWSKYSSVYGTFDQVFRKDILASPKKIVTRKVKINFETGVPMQPEDSSKVVVRRGSQANRSQTFKVAWTIEEQRKLEELLLKYPSEEIEFNRYRKIAAELENRTPMQVQSRVQKYFIKLAKAGLPIPGHMPRVEKNTKSGWRNKRTRSHPHQQLTRMSTFFPRFHVPVRMNDKQQDNNNEDDEGFTIDKDQVSDEEDVSHEMRFSDEYIEILRLKRIRRERLRVFDNKGQQALAQHVGYECDMCNSDPIQGVRYHCIDCPPEECVDLCQSCIRLQGQFETMAHKTTHRMEPVYKSETFVDDDYLKFVSRSGDYNYLDPNFFPPKT
ncbi:uncharacterized protein LOC120344576 [Styela clava]